MAPLVAPKFSNVTEEADWWYAHRGEVEAEIFRAHEAGQTGRDTLAKRLQQLKLRQQSASLVVELDGTDAVRAREVATRRGVSYADYVRSLVHRGLDQDQNQDQAELTA